MLPAEPVNRKDAADQDTGNVIIMPPLLRMRNHVKGSLSNRTSSSKFGSRTFNKGNLRHTQTRRAALVRRAVAKRARQGTDRAPKEMEASSIRLQPPLRRYKKPNGAHTD